MWGGTSNFFCSTGFMPHGHCFFWRSDLLTLHVTSDVLIALAFFSIPLCMVYVIRRRSDLPFRSLFWLFGVFIVACGFTHLMSVYTIWQPAYWLSGWMKAGTAAVSVFAAFALVRAVPNALQLPSPDELRRLNEELERRVEARTSDLRASNNKLAQEIRQRQEAESEVRRLNESLEFRVGELQTLLDLLPVGIAIAHDANSGELRTNQAFAEVTGVAPARHASLSAPPIQAPAHYRVFEGDRELLPDEVPLRRALIENRPVLDKEYLVRRLDGREFQVLVSAVPLRDENGNARGAVSTVQDITAQKVAGQERLEFERRMQEAQKLESLGVLAGGIAHDFNNLLTGILGNASLARLDLPAGHATVRASLDSLEQAALRAADLCKQMLAYAGKGRFAIQPLGISGLVKETAELLEVSLGRKSLLKLELEPGLPAFQGDATQVRQILMNLVINASEALGEKGGAIVIRTGRLDATAEQLQRAGYRGELSSGSHVYVEVCDDGCGMDPATSGRIFDPFFTTKFTGRGLGLAAVMGIVRGHHGAIKVTTQVGHGTTFSILFPAIDQPATPPTPILHASSIEKSSGSLLLADDEETVRTVAAKILSSHGYEVTVARDGVDAVDVFRSDPPHFDAVLLDLTMPRMDGEAAFQELQKIRPDVRVLLMSGFNEQDMMNRFIGRGVAGFLPKPFSAEMLLTRLREALAQYKK